MEPREWAAIVESMHQSVRKATLIPRDAVVAAQRERQRDRAEEEEAAEEENGQ